MWWPAGPQRVPEGCCSWSVRWLTLIGSADLRDAGGPIRGDLGRHLGRLSFSGDVAMLRALLPDL